MYQPPTIAQLKVTLLDIEPAIWRRLLVPRTATLADLHHILQAAFGWWDCHLHEFRIGGLRYGDADLLNEDAFVDDSRALSAAEVRLLDFGHRSPPFLYIYDFGDDWRHLIEIETLLVPEPGRKYPACVDGARSRPPEDVGGTGGYERFLESWSDPRNPAHRDMRRWAGRAFHPEAFDRDKVDKALRSALAASRRPNRSR